MEQEAEPEGGPIATRYGIEMQRVMDAQDKIIAKIKVMKDKMDSIQADFDAKQDRRAELQKSAAMALKS